MKRLDSSSLRIQRGIVYLETRFVRKLIIAVTAFALLFSQTAPALAYEPGNAFAEYSDVRAMVDLSIPLGAPQADKVHAISFGFTLKRNFRFNDPIYETVSGSYQNSQHLTVNAINLRFGMNGTLAGFEVGGFKAFQEKMLLSAAEDNQSEGSYCSRNTFTCVAAGAFMIALIVGSFALNEQCWKRDYC